MQQHEHFDPQHEFSREQAFFSEQRQTVVTIPTDAIASAMLTMLESIFDSLILVSNSQAGEFRSLGFAMPDLTVLKHRKMRIVATKGEIYS